MTARFEAGRDNRIEPRLFQSLGFLDCRGRADGEDPSLAAGLQNILRGNPEDKACDRRLCLKQSFNLRSVILREPRRRFRCLKTKFAVVRREPATHLLERRCAQARLCFGHHPQIDRKGPARFCADVSNDLRDLRRRQRIGTK